MIKLLSLLPLPRPIIKMLDKLLLCGALDNIDVEKLLILIHPATWDNTFSKDGKDIHRKGFLNMKIHEGVKLELCHLLHHLCDVQLRHRIEFTVAFCQDYMGELQVDQLRRYVEIKQSDMPSAVAAKKTKEFRCPPRDQMNTILCFKNLDVEELEDAACNEELRSKMLNFHDTIMKVISIESIEAEDEDPDKEKDKNKQTVWAAVMRALRPPQKLSEEEQKALQESGRMGGPHSQEEKFRKVLVETVIRWGCEAEIENTDLVREMFSLLLRQYDTVGELMRATENTYIVDAKTKEDVDSMWVSLGRIRSLLPVQMSRIEEALVRELLWQDRFKRTIHFIAKTVLSKLQDPGEQPRVLPTP
jgi:ryanodine receptor 2